MKQEDIRRQLIRAIDVSGKSIFALARESGVGYASLHALVNDGADVTLSTLSKLANVLDLELIKRRNR